MGDHYLAGGTMESDQHIEHHHQQYAVPNHQLSFDNTQSQIPAGDINDSYQNQQQMIQNNSYN